MEFAKSTQNQENIPKHQINQSNRKQYGYYLKRENEPKIRIKATRWNFQAHPKILKNYPNTKYTN
jgi:hypothetical protein